jgi:hypothetical protein
MALGEVDIMPFEGGEHLGQYVAFAASVEAMTSSVGAIEDIGRALGEFTAKCDHVRVVAAPLLGAGAGGIQSEKVVRALKVGFTSAAAAGATLLVYVLHQNVFDRVKSNRQHIQGTIGRPFRVFISHTSASDTDVEWVKSLALFLLDKGIQSRLDRFHLRRGMDLQQWMSNELSMADKVLVVCDEVYKRKADGRLGGVGWETMIIQGDIAVPVQGVS